MSDQPGSNPEIPELPNSNPELSQKMRDALADKSMASQSPWPIFGEDGNPLLAVAEEPIGKGGFGTVYQAVGMESSPYANQELAVKVLPITDPSLRDEAVQEAFSQAMTENIPGIIRIYDAIIHEVPGKDGKMIPALILITELKNPERTLDKLIAKGEIHLHQVPEIAAKIATILANLGNNGIAHRDVKLSNVFLDEDGNPSLADFGTANLFEKINPQNGALVGTARYLAPEVVNEDPIRPATDLYSLGVAIYEAMTGHHPFDYPFSADIDSANQFESQSTPKNSDTPRYDHDSPTIDYETTTTPLPKEQPRPDNEQQIQQIIRQFNTPYQSLLQFPDVVAGLRAAGISPEKLDKVLERATAIPEERYTNGLELAHALRTVYL